MRESRQIRRREVYLRVSNLSAVNIASEHLYDIVCSESLTAGIFFSTSFWKIGTSLINNPTAAPAPIPQTASEGLQREIRL